MIPMLVLASSTVDGFTDEHYVLSSEMLAHHDVLSLLRSFTSTYLGKRHKTNLTIDNTSDKNANM